ncbi:MAG: hypothetical protein JNK78_13775 [Planctomycetes bacterium]|nr:hypothetical protein [Planctomycetota bacterium]
MATSLLSLTASVPALVAALLVAGLPAQDKPMAGEAKNDNGFLTGLRGFENFHEPLGQPLYFESPFNDTSLRFLYLRHNFSNDSTLQGGHVTVYAMQARVALTDRLAFIATKDGYSELESGIIQDEGWNDLAAGFKYVLHADKEKQYVVTPGIRYQMEQGHRGILQGGVDEVSPFVSLAKGYDDLHLLANLTLRLPLDGDEGNTVGHWDLHVDYDVNPGAQAVVAPLFEIHGVHYLDDGTSTLNVGGLDYTNLGSQPKDDFVCWAGIGVRAEIDKKYEVGICYEFALTDPDNDIMDSRITFDLIARW